MIRGPNKLAMNKLGGNPHYSNVTNVEARIITNALKVAENYRSSYFHAVNKRIRAVTWAREKLHSHKRFNAIQDTLRNI